MPKSSGLAVLLRVLIGVTALVLLALLLFGCAHAPSTPPEPAVVFREVKVAVPTGCVVDKPGEVKPLNQQVTADQWNALAPGAKAEAVAAQAGTRLNYEDRLRASTSGCGPAK